MRFRIFYLVVLASLLGTPVLVRRMNRIQRCDSIPDPAICGVVAPDPGWMVPAGLCSIAALAMAGVVYTQAWSARHREKEMLDDVGVKVREEDLPLEE